MSKHGQIDMNMLRINHQSRMKWKDYLKDEADWEQEVDYTRDFPTFVIKGNDVF
jgi:hypothetical protein